MRPRTKIAACQRQGVRRLVLVGALGAAVDAASDYQQTKAQGEAALMASGLDWTIVRPSVIFGRGDSFLNLFADLLAVRLAPDGEPEIVSENIHGVQILIFSRSSKNPG